MRFYRTLAALGIVLAAAGCAKPPAPDPEKYTRSNALFRTPGGDSIVLEDSDRDGMVDCIYNISEENSMTGSQRILLYHVNKDRCITGMKYGSMEMTEQMRRDASALREAINGFSFSFDTERFARRE
ncbi:MAG: hypothetical protein HYW25_05770 [Candidatus Aenigmarchaeota archaeon]|nr:hypothetical protein [Candidatus Aenigmarchaeota archaeon]